MATTFRKNMADGLKSALDDFQTIHPTRLYSVSRVQPGNLSAGPLAYVGDRDERIKYSAGVRNRQMAPTIIVVDSLTDREEYSERMDETVDLMVDFFQARERTIVTNAVVALIRIDDRELRVGDVIYPITVLTFNEPGDLAEGRG